MKYIVATDIHGSLFWAKKIIEKFNEEDADKLVLLGDLYYHGPRNPLPQEYAPMEVAKLFNQYSDRIIAVRGNCDADIDQSISLFKMNKSAKIRVARHTVFFTHGDKYNKTNFPSLNRGDVIVYGHYHINEVIPGEVTAINLASASLPKNGAKPAFLIIDEKSLTVFAFSGEEIYNYCF